MKMSDGQNFHYFHPWNISSIKYHKSNHQQNFQSTEDVTSFYCRKGTFKYSCFPSTILELNNLDMKNTKS